MKLQPGLGEFFRVVKPGGFVNFCRRLGTELTEGYQAALDELARHQLIEALPISERGLATSPPPLELGRVLQNARRREVAAVELTACWSPWGSRDHLELANRDGGGLGARRNLSHAAQASFEIEVEKGERSHGASEQGANARNAEHAQGALESCVHS